MFLQIVQRFAWNSSSACKYRATRLSPRFQRVLCFYLIRKYILPYGAKGRD